MDCLAVFGSGDPVTLRLAALDRMMSHVDILIDVMLLDKSNIISDIEVL